MTSLYFNNQSGTSESFHINQNDLSGHVITDQIKCIAHHDDAIIQYSFIDDTIRYFSINSTTAVVTMVVDGLDILCSSPSCDYTPTIRCTSSSASQDLATNKHEVQHAAVEITISFSIDNEFRPVFTHNSTLTVSIREDINITLNPQVEILNATDRDLGVCGQITYSIFSGNLEGKFRIDTQTGVITLISELDYEITPSYTLTVHALNTFCPRQLKAAARLFIQVINIDDELPIFIKHAYTFSYMEGSQPIDFVRLQCIDEDTPSENIKYGEAFTEWPFHVNLDTGLVSATQTLDYEHQSSYELQFQCYDLSHPEKPRDSAVVYVEVLPVNEHSPVLPRSSLSRTINNTIPTGTLIASNIPNTNAVFFIGATDQDRGLNHGKIEFKLSPKNNMEIMNEFFSLDSNTGNLTLIKSLQYFTCRNTSKSTISRLTIVVSVCNSHNGSCENLQIIMFVQHLANCGPNFSQTAYHIEVNESVVNGTKLERIVCSTLADSKGRVSTTITVISSDLDVKRHFRVDNDTMVVHRTLDYEQRKNFTFQIKCSDSSGNEPAYAEVNVTVMPANDNSPRFEVPFMFFNFSASKHFHVPYTIGQIQAVDNDKDLGNVISYRVLPGSDMASDADDGQYLHVDNAGFLTLIKSTSELKYPKLVALVEATDGVFSDQVLLVITIKTQTTDLSMNSSDNNASSGVRSTLVAIVVILLFSLLIVIIVSIVIICYYRQKQRKCILKFQKSVLEHKDSTSSLQLQRNQLQNNLVPANCFK